MAGHTEEIEVGKKNILLIDDDQDILTLERMFLSREGFNVDTAETGAEAIEISRKKIIACSLIDIVLPDMQGTELIRKLANGPPVRMRKIMVTGNATMDNAIEALNLGAHAFVQKPIKPEELLATVKEQLQEQHDESVMTQKKISKFIDQNKADFVKVVKTSLNSLLGETTADSTIFHLGGEDAIRDPKVFAEKARSFFDVGAETILQQILKNLESTKTPSSYN